jgi:thymidylate synthase ThyX
LAYSAKVIADSVSEVGHRLTTMEVTFPRMVLAEFNTHRMFSRNSASSRAIPVTKQLERIKSDPFIPIHWGANQAGMQANAELSLEDQDETRTEWLAARDSAVRHVEKLLAIGLHKQITNRLLEPFMWHTVIVTATEWSNFFALRANPDAQPEIRRAAELMREAMDASTPQLVKVNEWHLPFIGYTLPREHFNSDQKWNEAIEASKRELDWAKENPGLAIEVSIGRCARVSYLTHDGQRDISKDMELYDRLTSSGHMSPLEHVATPMSYDDIVPGRNAHGDVFGQENPWSGNFHGWRQFRKTIRNESDFSKVEG